MMHTQSEWWTGFKFAEQQAKDGWKISGFNPVENWFAWAYQGAKQTVFGESEWLDGVLAYYKQQAHNADVLFEGWLVEELGTEYEQNCLVIKYS